MISHFFTAPSVSFLLPHLHPDLLIRASVEDAAVHGTVPYVPAHGDADVLFPGGDGVVVGPVQGASAVPVLPECP